MNDENQSTLPAEKSSTPQADHTKPDRPGRQTYPVGTSSPKGRAPSLNPHESSHAETVSMLKKQYQLAKRQKQWLKITGLMGVLVMLLGGLGTWLAEENKDFKMAILRVVSPVVSIHLDPEMVAIPAGTFQQGDSRGEDTLSEHPLRKVHIKKFALGRFEVTFEEYDRFAMATDRAFPGDEGWGREKRPVINVSWEDARDYAKWLSEGTGLRYRLPTESEWEYAAKNRAEDEIWAGTSEQEQLGTYAWFNTNSTGRTQPVGTRQANGLGLQDMSGNVWEWVQDCWHDDYHRAPTNGLAWLEANNGRCGTRVRRGGGWTNDPISLRSSFRNGYNADSRSIQIGFRLAQDID
ncbi:formylglycine-generating enzyme family protein [Nitrospira sp. MA-1]|nr:formylglycine-generating enzyme family protein [Nitrospira sp. MA-1]